MALIKEIWRKEIIGGLYKDNSFIQRAVNASSFVKEGTIVHIPSAGAGSNVEVDRTSLPASISERTDTEVVYTLKEFTTDPKLIKNIDEYQLSYDKMQSVLAEDIATLKEKVAEWMIRLWAPAEAARFLRTTGADRAASAPGASGNRKGFTKSDLKRARLLLNKESVPTEGRVALIPSDLMDFLLDDDDLKKRDNSLELDMKGGVVTRLYGFDLMERPTVQIYDNAGTPVAKNPGAAGAAADNQSVLCWHPATVEYAQGNIEPFYRLNDPTYFGNVFSFLVMMGGRRRRADNKGVVSIIEAAGA